MKEKVMNGLEKFSKAMLSPLSYISAAGLILVLGALLTSTSLSAMIPALQWTPIKLLGQLIYNCIMVIIPAAPASHTWPPCPRPATGCAAGCAPPET